MSDLIKSLSISEKKVSLLPALRMLMVKGKNAPILSLISITECSQVFEDKNAFEAKLAPITSRPILDLGDLDLSGNIEELKEIVANYIKKNSNNPSLILVNGLGIICCSVTKGHVDLLRESVLKILNGETVETRECSGSSEAVNSESFISGKVFIITGAGAGFGKGIAELLFERGANIVIADINEPAALATAEELNKNKKENAAVAIISDISNPDSLKDLVEKTTVAFGGVDVLISNAGVVKAGGLTELAEKDFDFVTKINYTAYYLITKYVSEILKIQHLFNPTYTSDIIQINSKSGLTGSNKNFAYAGSKFGGIGLTQSFALELVEFNIKVNSVCPGNFFDGPLWSDPDRGLFVQYLKAGKVAGAKSVGDVKKFYENKVPMSRGCTSIDVVKAILYIIDQQYETGQSIPVTGGQEMLN